MSEESNQETYNKNKEENLNPLYLEIEILNKEIYRLKLKRTSLRAILIPLSVVILLGLAICSDVLVGKWNIRISYIDYIAGVLALPYVITQTVFFGGYLDLLH